MLFIVLAVTTPIIKTAFDDSGTVSNSVSDLDTIVKGSSYLSIWLNIAFVPFWTFGLNTWINLLLLLPIRVAMLAAFWFILSPAK